MKYTFITLVVLHVALSAWAGTLTDNFDDGNIDDWIRLDFGGPDFNWSIENGELVLSSKDSCGRSEGWIIGDGTWINYEFEVKFRIAEAFPVECARSIVNFGVHTTSSAAEFSTVALSNFERDGFWNTSACASQLLGVQTVHKVAPLTLPIEKWHTARIVVNDNHYQMAFNDQVVCEVDIERPDRGAAGISLSNANVSFDDVIITGDNVPDTALPVGLKQTTALAWGALKVTNTRK